jgi:hypothetical protein
MDQVLTDCYVKIGDDEFSGRNTNVALSVSSEAVDITAMGMEFRKRDGGLKDWGFSAEFVADADTATKLFGFIGEIIPVEVRPNSGARSVTNPAFVGEIHVASCNPLEGSVGEAWKISLSGEGSGALELLTVDA